MRREAQAHLDQAKKLATDALNIDSEALEVNRAMADYLRVDGAPAPEVQRYLDRAQAKRSNDPETVYVAGALALRDGKLDEAKAKLAQANQLNLAATQHALVRASMLLARVQLQTGDKEGARLQLQTVLAINKQHDRAAALQALLDAEGGGAAPASGVAAAPSGATAAPAPAASAAAPSGSAAKPAAAQPTPPTPAPAPAAATVASASGSTPVPKSDSGSSSSSGGGGGGDYAHLVQQADRLSENGHGKEARKLYERALQLQPNGLEAITGIAYAELDGEKFSAAVDHFKRALAISPNFGEAIIGLAEAYKLRGDRKEALGWYKLRGQGSPIAAVVAAAGVVGRISRRAQEGRAGHAAGCQRGGATRGRGQADAAAAPTTVVQRRAPALRGTPCRSTSRRTKKKSISPRKTRRSATRSRSSRRARWAPPSSSASSSCTTCTAPSAGSSWSRSRSRA
jgi:tetratricopeptide (TPR) repeat protein